MRIAMVLPSRNRCDSDPAAKFAARVRDALYANENIDFVDTPEPGSADVVHIIGAGDGVEFIRALHKAQRAGLPTVATLLLQDHGSDSRARMLAGDGIHAGADETAVRRGLVNVLARLGSPRARHARNERNLAFQQREALHAADVVLFATYRDKTIAATELDVVRHAFVAVLGDDVVDATCIEQAYRSAQESRESDANSVDSWNARFASGDWEAGDHRLQTALLAAGFALVDFDFGDVQSVLDYGSALGDSLPVLHMRFPHARLSYFDISSEAMRSTRLRYGMIANPAGADDVHDVVYCSNVIEHVDDAKDLLTRLLHRSNRWVVIQAPWGERHPDGSRLSPQHPQRDHIRTVDEEMLAELNMHPSYRTLIEVPWAWTGPQAVLVWDTSTQ
ncbi:MAG: class I SAM-dependent methyltransferase [Coriobacteriales bacterium]